MRTTFPFQWVCIFVFLLMPSLGTARSQGILTPAQKAMYMKYYTRGNGFLYSGKYVPAIVQFKMAIKLAPELPGAWRQLGLSHEGHKEYKSAIKAYEQYLSIVGSGGKYSVKVMLRINVCRKKLGLPFKQFKALFVGRPGDIIVKTDIVGAVIRVDNIQRASTPAAPIPAKPGLHTMTVTKEGYLPWSTSVVMHPEERVVVEPKLKKDPKHVAKTQLPSGVLSVGPDFKEKLKKGILRVEVDVKGYKVKLDGKPRKKNSEGEYLLEPRQWLVEISAHGRLSWRGRVKMEKGRRRVLKVTLPKAGRRANLNRWAWITLGTAAVLGGVGMVFGLLENRAAEKVRDGNVSASALADWKDKDKAYGAVAGAFYGVGAAALVTSAVLFILKRRVEAHTKGRFSFGVGPMGRGKGVGVTWGGEVSLP